MEQFIIFDKTTSEDNLRDLNISVSNDSRIEFGAKLYANCCVSQGSLIQSGAEIHTNSVICDSIIGREAKVFSSRIFSSRVGEKSIIGPFAEINNSRIENSCRIGNFSVMENSSMFVGSKVKALCVVKNFSIARGYVLESGGVLIGEKNFDAGIIRANDENLVKL